MYLIQFVPCSNCTVEQTTNQSTQRSCKACNWILRWTGWCSLTECLWSVTTFCDIDVWLYKYMKYIEIHWISQIIHALTQDCIMWRVEMRTRENSVPWLYYVTLPPFESWLQCSVARNSGFLPLRLRPQTRIDLDTEKFDEIVTSIDEISQSYVNPNKSR